MSLHDGENVTNIIGSNVSSQISKQLECITHKKINRRSLKIHVGKCSRAMLPFTMAVIPHMCATENCLL